MTSAHATPKQDAQPRSPPEGSFTQAPAVTLPKGGGAIRGIGEKFAANPVTGTGSMSVPIATSPGRAGFGPQLSLTYDSGAGNGPFGFGWSVSLPSITRKTDKGLPQYFDAVDSDIFILSGAEDLVPVLVQHANGEWIPEDPPRERTVDGKIYRIRRYRPRIEGLFARIERWTNTADATDVFWRSLSKDNITTWYGRTADSRIADPFDATRIFSWLICETHDDKGNLVAYGYKPEDSKRIFEDSAGKPVTKAHERNRSEETRSAQRYIKRIRYGNRAPFLPRLKADAAWPEPPAAPSPKAPGTQPLDGSDDWMFEVVFDYGEHDTDTPTPTEAHPWPARPDPFSSYRAGFEVRTYRICQRVLMFHHFPGEIGVERDCLVRSTDFTFSDEVNPTDARNPVYTFLKAVTQTGHRRNGGAYDHRSLPPVEFTYTEPTVQETVEEVDPTSVENLPIGLDGSAYRWTDLHGEGIPGILTEQAGTWLYKRNLSPTNERPGHGPDGPDGPGQIARRPHVEAAFATLETVALKPNVTLGAGAEFMDLAGDGHPDVVLMEGPTPGLYEHDEAEGWQPFRPFTSRLNRDLRDPNLKFVDLDGDGHADVLITEDDALVWHASLAEAGFGPARRVAQALDEEKGPRVVFADGTQSIYLADLSGDGLTDIVRIRNGEVCYWPNLGHCRFGAKVTMDHAPWFDHPDQFDHKRIRLADIDGSGTTDIIYLHRNGVRLYFNQSGNGWSQPQALKVFPRIDDLVSIVPTDLLGNGTACLVWSSPLPGDARCPMRYVNLMGGQKPHLLVKTVNNLGAETRVDYAPSTKFYLQDKRDGKPWITRLPFPVRVVERVETIDHISRNRFVTRYAYHHGYFDGEEREFRGFGMVEQWDTEHLGILQRFDVAENAAEDGPQSRPPKCGIGQLATASVDGVWQFTFRPIIAIKPSVYANGAWFYFFEGVNGGIHENDVLLLEDASDHALGGIWDGTPEAEMTVPNRGGSSFAANIDESSYVPPVHTKTWFHTGVYLGREHVSDYFAGLLNVTDQGEYFREPGLTDLQARALLLPDTELPEGLMLEEVREACRALKGSMLRQEVYADDADHPGATQEQIERARRPYTVTEQNFTIRPLQPRGGNGHAVFFTHAREALTYHYERTPTDPRIQHALTLEVDDSGNVLKQAAIGYGRRKLIRVVDDRGKVQQVPNPGLIGLDATDQAKQTTSLLTYTENRVTNPVDTPDMHRTPLPCEAVTFELTGYTPSGAAGRFQVSDLVEPDPVAAGRLRHKLTDQVPYEAAATGNPCRRPIEWLRTLYRRDDLNGLLPLGDLHSLALPGESYKLALTPGLLDQVFKRPRQGEQDEPLLPEAARTTILGGQSGNEGGYVDLDRNGHWWIPSGRAFYHPDDVTTSVELAEARAHFFLLRRYRDPFGQNAFVDFDAHDLLMVETRDPLDNRVTVEANDYRVLQPRLVSDPNRNQTEVAFDTLGMVVGTAVMSKPTENPRQGDRLDGLFSPDPPQVLRDAFIGQPREAGATPNISVATQAAHDLLANATTRIVYDLDRYMRLGEPPFAATIARETHVSDLRPGGQSKLQISFSYSDGFGREIQKKIQAEPGPLVEGGPVVNPRWVGSGWTIFNNKGQPVRQYEPFFSASHDFELAVIAGVSPVLFYDPLGRVVATLHPDHTYEKAIFETWRQVGWDVNDTVRLNPKTDPDVSAFFTCLPDSAYLPTWYGQRMAGPSGEAERASAQKAARHADTPSVTHFDALGRAVLSVADNGRDEAGDPQWHATRTVFDIEGNIHTVIDALGRIVMRYDYDLLGRQVHQSSMEAGERWILNDVAGQPIFTWNSRQFIFRTEYDALRRPVRHLVRGGDQYERNGQVLSCEILFARTIYGDTAECGLTEHRQREANLRGKVFRRFDGSGVVTMDCYDFKGNLLRSTRQFAREYKSTPDWANAPALESERFEARTSYDALNRVISTTSPDRSIYRPSYNEANLLEQVDVALRGACCEGRPTWTPFVGNIDYNAKGQRVRIEYGNGATTHYKYDAKTFRLARLRTVRPANRDEFAAQIFTDGGCVQDLHYYYDPAGNITEIADRALRAVFHDNRRVEPVSRYTYDPLYRLIEATGREHSPQSSFQLQPANGNYRDFPFLGAAGSADPSCLQNYTEQYEYDAAGNFLRIAHLAGKRGWTRHYAYDEPSLIEPAKRSNRLSYTRVGGECDVPREPCLHDAHGNIVQMQHLPLMRWDFMDRLASTSRQVVDCGTPETTFYVYDADGQRVRKVTERQNGTRKNDRLYIGGFEIFREQTGSGDEIALERETLHVMDDAQRIALVETRTIDRRDALLTPDPVQRYQLANHLGSASLELDEAAALVSYEEYAPYGTTTYQAGRSACEVSLKRYRYTGKERDEENGFNYHGARYYAVWLGRWVSCDPNGILDGGNMYVYVRGNPMSLIDPSGLTSTLNLIAEDMQAQRGQELKERADDPYIAEQVSKEEVADLMTLKNGDMIEKYGWDRRNQIRESAYKMSSKDLARALPAEDQTVYLQPSGRQATNAQERETVRSEKVANFNPGTPIGGVVRTVALIAGASPETVENLGKVGDLAEGLLPVATAGIARWKAARAQSASSTAAGSPPQSPPVTEPTKPPGSASPPSVTPPSEPPPLPRMSDRAIAQHHLFNVNAENLLRDVPFLGGTWRRDLGNLNQQGLVESLQSNPASANLYLGIQQRPGASVPDLLHIGSGTGKPFGEITSMNPATVEAHRQRWYWAFSDPLLYPAAPSGWNIWQSPGGNRLRAWQRSQ